MILSFLGFKFLAINCIVFFSTDHSSNFNKHNNYFSQQDDQNSNRNLNHSKKIMLYDNLKLLEIISNYEMYLNACNFSKPLNSKEYIKSKTENSDKKKHLEIKIEELSNLKYLTQKSILTTLEIKKQQNY